jgi:hypothetical protein
MARKRIDAEVFMAPYWETVPCKVCETRVYITGTRRNGASAKANGVAVTCPICGSVLSIAASSIIDMSTIQIVGIESKSPAKRSQSKAS